MSFRSAAKVRDREDDLGLVSLLQHCCLLLIFLGDIESGVSQPRVDLIRSKMSQVLRA
jgi:hypothetical protein